jgi:toxin YoeB
MKITKVLWTEESWEDYEYCQKNDKQKLKNINELIKAIKRESFDGIGKPGKLKYEEGIWSRRINIEHRLTYKIFDDTVYIVTCRFHYDE